MKSVKMILSGIILAVLFGACNNFFHDLVPPDGDRIISFEVEGQLKKAKIGNNSVKVELKHGTDPGALIPVVKVSPRASLIPVTLEYIQAAFPSADLKELALGLYDAYDLEAYVESLIKKHADFKVPKLDIPIDFSGPVDFFVVAGQGNMRRYTVTMEIDSNEASLTGFVFSKYDNPELVQDALAVINESARTITVNALYPAEMTLSYELIPSFEIRGNSAEVDGVKISSGVSILQFAPVLDTQQTKMVKVIRGDSEKEYTLTITFKEDPDSIRSITDFRFTKTNNSGIAITAVASILNNENLGSINVQVFYAGAKPSTLAPQFISPGTVSVSDMTQISGTSSHDFSHAVEYRVVSRNNKYVRTYTVQVDFIDISAASPVIESFRFLCGVNHELVQDTTASISNSSGVILITASYGGNFAPGLLIPEFRATGIVTVRSAVQISDSSAQDFSTQVKYTVTDPVNPLLTRDYWVKVSFTRDTSSDAKINSFSFHPAENPLLADEIVTRIDQNAGTINVYAPIGSGATTRVMIPRFLAVGHVEVGGVMQTSGQSGHYFDVPVIYTVVSANGVNRKEYIVTVRELQSTLYVNQNAHGLSDGTNWQNAFRDLKDAIEAAVQFPADVSKEIWIAAGTYIPDDHFQIVSHTSYIGGFAGNETAKSQRNVAANAVTITGGSGVTRLFFGAEELTGDIVFENLSIKDHKGSAIYAQLDNNAQVTIADCGFSNISVTYNVVRIEGGGVYIRDTTFSGCFADNGVVYLDCSGETDILRVTAEDSPIRAFNLNGNGGKELESVKITNGMGIQIANSSGNITINDLELSDITGAGITMTNVTGVKYLSGIAGQNISGNAISSSSLGAGAFTLINSNFNSVGSLTVSGSSALVTVRDTGMNNTSGSSTLSVTTTSSVTIDTVAMDRVGMVITSGGTAQILDSDIKNYSGQGINLSGSGSAYLSNVSIDTVSSDGVYNTQDGTLMVEGLELKNITGTGIYKKNGSVNLANIKASKINGNAVYCEEIASGSAILKDSEFNNTGEVIIESLSYVIPVPVVQIINTKIYNSSLIRYQSALTIDTRGQTTIDRVTIDGVSNGRGIYVNTASVVGAVQISNSSIKNCKTVATGGGGIWFQGRGDQVISNTTIENVETSSTGGGIFSRGGNLTVTGSRFENCYAGSYGGAIYSQNVGDSEFLCELSDTVFVNCAGRGSSGSMIRDYSDARILVTPGAIVTRCTFTHDSNYIDKGEPLSINVIAGDYISCSFGGTITFENCTFNNLKGNNTGQNYLFNYFRSYPGDSPSGNGVRNAINDITLRNCTFNLDADSAGIAALGSPSNQDSSDYILMDGNRINNNGISQPILWFNGNSPNNTFQFKANNYYNGTLIDTAAKITGLGTSVIRLTNGAMPVLVP